MYKYLVVLFLFFSFANANELIEGSGVEDIKKESFKNITKFNIKTSIDTSVIKSKNSYYILIGDDNIIDEINISFANNELIVSTDKSFKTKSDLKLYIYIDKIKSIRVNGAMDLNFKSLNEKSLDIIANGTIDISATNKSFVDRLSVVTNGAVDVDFKNLKSKTTKLNLSGVGDVVITSLRKPEISAKDSHDILNLYNPKEIVNVKSRGKKVIIKDSRIISKPNAYKNVKSTENNCPPYSACTVKGRNVVINNNIIKGNTTNLEEKTFYNELIDLINKNEITEFENNLAGKNINVYNKYSPTLLYESATTNKKEFIKLLINRGATSNTKTSKYKETPLHGAIRSNNIDIAFYLIDKIDNLNIKNSAGQTPLHLATQRAMNSMIKRLVNSGANKNIKDNAGKIPYDIARYKIEIDKNVLQLLKVGRISIKNDYSVSDSYRNGRITKHVNNTIKSKKDKKISNMKVYIGN